MGTTNTDELLGMLHSRAEMLECLRESPAPKRELARACGVSRSTIDRGITDLTDVGVVERRDGRYRLTPYGELVHDTFRELRSTLETLQDARPIVESWPEAPPLEAAVFEGATVTAQRALGPTLVDRYLQPADTIRLAHPLLVVVYGALNRRNRESALRDKEIEVVLDGEIVEHLEAYYEPELDALAAENDLTVYTSTDTFPFTLGVLTTDGTRSVLLLFDRGDESLAVLENDRRSAVEWATAAYERHRSAAADNPTPVSPSATEGQID